MNYWEVIHKALFFYRLETFPYESAYRTHLALGKIGIKSKVKAPTSNQAADDFLEWSKVQHSQKPKSYDRIEFSCRSLKKLFGETKVDQIESKDIEKFVVYRSQQKSRKTGNLITRDSVNLGLRVLKTIFKRLISAKVLSDNPAKDIKRLPENEKSFHVLSRDEEKVYLLARPQPLQDMASIMLETGMRPNEVNELKRKNISIEKGFLQIENGKTRSSNRKVWLSDKALKLLQARLDKFKGDYLFPKDDKDYSLPVSYQLNIMHRTVLERTCQRFRLYDCRHTFATRVLESGTELLTLASMFGHSNLIRYIQVLQLFQTTSKPLIKGLS
ncbi:MAG TPA: tyrosine-type recombinase/integrase [Pyrinomonadaceae bacterium]